MKTNFGVHVDNEIKNDLDNMAKTLNGSRSQAIALMVSAIKTKNTSLLKVIEESLTKEREKGNANA